MAYKKIIKTIFCLLISVILFNGAYSFAETQPGVQSNSSVSTYLIGPGDLLNIYVWREAELTQDVTVMPDGSITFPLIGEIKAQGQTVADLKRAITEKLKNYVSAPEVTVIIRESRSRRVYTIGKLNQPGPYPLAPDMTVLQALSTAGGFTEWAETKYIMIVRRTGGNDVMYRFNYDEFISGKNLSQNILLEPNDTIVVP